MSWLCKTFGHFNKRIGTTTTHPPDVRLAKVYQCRCCGEQAVKPDGQKTIATRDMSKTLVYRGHCVSPFFVGETQKVV